MRLNATYPLLISIIAAFANPEVYAQTTVSSPISWQRYTLKSAALAAERPYYVILPESYRHDEQARYPVVLVLDADDEPQFVSTLGNMRLLRGRGEIPDVIIVAVPNGPDRTHDLTPVFSGNFAKRWPNSGGAPQFSKFLTSELLPEIGRTHRTAPGTILVGHSFAGLLGLYVAINTPGTFSGIVAVSPALQFNEGAEVSNWGKALSRQTAPLRLALSSGGLEPDIDINTKRFAALLDSINSPHLTREYRFLPDMIHGLTSGPGSLYGLQFIFKPVSLQTLLAAVPRPAPTADSTAIVRNMEQMEKQYAENARSLSISEVLPEEILNIAAYTAMQRKQIGAALVLFRRNAVLHPGSANVFDSLGDGFIAVGDSVNARAQFAKAVELARKSNHPVLEESAQKLARLQEQ